jgi:hypothetical protein
VDVDARKRQIQLSMKEANAVEDEPETEPELTLMEQAFQQARATARPRRESVQNQLRGEKVRGRGEQNDIMRRTLAQRGPRD